MHDYGYKIYGTPGTARFLNSEMVPCSVVRQMSGARPNVIDLLESGLVDYIISTSPHGRDPHRDSVKFRRKATELSIPTITAMDTARVLVCRSGVWAIPSISPSIYAFGCCVCSCKNSGTSL